MADSLIERLLVSIRSSSGSGEVSVGEARSEASPSTVNHAHRTTDPLCAQDPLRAQDPSRAISLSYPVSR